jgi:hypothetical protein
MISNNLAKVLVNLYKNLNKIARPHRSREF